MCATPDQGSRPTMRSKPLRQLASKDERPPIAHTTLRCSNGSIGRTASPLHHVQPASTLRVGLDYARTTSNVKRGRGANETAATFLSNNCRDARDAGCPKYFARLLIAPPGSDGSAGPTSPLGRHGHAERWRWISLRPLRVGQSLWKASMLPLLALHHNCRSMASHQYPGRPCNLSPGPSRPRDPTRRHGSNLHSP